MFGELIGGGQAGFVFENPTNSESYYKIVPLGDKPISEYGNNSTKSRKFAVNRNQARLFYQLSKKDLGISQLPEIYSFFTGRVNSKLRQNFLRNNESDNPYLSKLLADLPVGEKIAVWEMERIPMLGSYGFEKLPPTQSADYQNLLTKLLELGFVVRDVANPENFGYREDGTQVFFDPIVADWPTTEADEFLQPVRYHNFVSSFGRDQFPIVARSIANNDYFTWYHDGGVMESEDTAESDLPSDLDFEKLYSELVDTAIWNNNQYPALETLNWFNPTYQKIAQQRAEQLWTAYYMTLVEMLKPFVNDLNMITFEETTETLYKVEELIYDYYTEITPENIISKTDTLSKELTKLETYDEDVWYDWEDPVLPTTFFLILSSLASPTVFFNERDKAFKESIKKMVGKVELKCGECDGTGTITHSHDDYDQEHTEWCEECSSGIVTVGEI